MSTIFERNMNAIRNRFNALADAIEKNIDNENNSVFADKTMSDEYIVGINDGKIELDNMQFVRLSIRNS